MLLLVGTHHMDSGEIYSIMEFVGELEMVTRFNNKGSLVMVISSPLPLFGFSTTHSRSEISSMEDKGKLNSLIIYFAREMLSW